MDGYADTVIAITIVNKEKPNRTCFTNGKPNLRVPKVRLCRATDCPTIH